MLETFLLDDFPSMMLFFIVSFSVCACACVCCVWPLILYDIIITICVSLYQLKCERLFYPEYRPLTQVPKTGMPGLAGSVSVWHAISLLAIWAGSWRQGPCGGAEGVSGQESGRLGWQGRATDMSISNPPTHWKALNARH